MKIAVVGPGYLPIPAVKGGAVETLTTTLLKNNYIKCNVDVYTIADEQLDKLAVENCNIIQIKKNFFFRCISKICNVFREKDEKTNYYQYQVVQRLKKQQYDCILVENNMILYNEIYKKYGDKFKLVFHLHNDFDETSKTPKLAKVIGNTAKEVICISQYIKRQFDKFSETTISNVVYNGIEQEKFCGIDLKKCQKLKESLNIKEEDTVFLYSGRIEKNKGVLELVKAFAMLDSVENMKLIIAGSVLLGTDRRDEYYNEIIKEAEKVKEKIFFVGQVGQADISSYYQVANVVVIPSLWEEPFCMTAAETMAAGCPIITTNSGGIVEVVDSECAIILDKDEHLIENISNSMSVLHENKKLREDMGLKAKERFKNKKEFTADYYYKEMWKLII